MTSAAASASANDADLRGEHAAQLRLEVLEVVAQRPSLRSCGRLLSLAPHELLGLADRQLAFEHDVQGRSLQLRES